MKLYRISSPVVVLVFAAACGGSNAESNSLPTGPAPAELNTAASSTPSSTSASNEPPYTPMDASSSSVREEVAQTITLLQNTRHDPSIGLVSIRSAAAQTLNGTSYKFELDLKTSAGARRATVVMQKDASGQRRIGEVTGI